MNINQILLFHCIFSKGLRRHIFFSAHVYIYILIIIMESCRGCMQVRGVKPMPLPEMANLFASLRFAVTPGLVSCHPFCLLRCSSPSRSRLIKFLRPLFQDVNPNNLVATTSFYSETTLAVLCLVRIAPPPPPQLPYFSIYFNGNESFVLSSQPCLFGDALTILSSVGES